MPETANGNVTANLSEGINTISFYHPAQNSLPSDLLDQLCKKIEEAGNDAGTRVILLKSEGDRTFCAGASFDELLQIKDKQAGAVFFSGFARVINACRKSSKIIIARVQGKAVGGGVGLAAAADYCLATQAASIKLSELAIGIGPFVVGPAIERKIGSAAFSQLAIDAGSWRNADWAKRKGLFAEVHEEAAGMDESVARLANSLAHSNPAAMADLKKVFWKGTEDWDSLLHERAVISGRLAISAFTKAAIAGFKK